MSNLNVDPTMEGGMLSRPQAAVILMNRPRLRGVSLSLAMLAGLIGGCALPGCTRTPTTSTSAARSLAQPENPFDVARDTLSKATDLETCRSVLQQLNAQSEHRPPGKDAAVEQLLAERFTLDGPLLTEATGTTFTSLDAHHFESCLLFRDAARALDVETLPPLEQAAAAFAWVTRQVRLQVVEEAAAPPAYVLRRGWGSALERGLVFTALLRQLGIDGCLIVVPGEKDEFRYWACGARVQVDKKDALALFDPRLGLPLPGANKQSIATLAEVQAQPGVLDQLASSEAPYDVTPDQLRRAEVRVVEPVSALASRLRFLQERLLEGPHRAQLAVNAGVLLKQLEQTTAAPVRVDPGAMLVHCYFLSPREGGADETQRRERQALALVPWQQMPSAVLNLRGDPGQRVQTYFGRPFIDFVMETKLPRDEYLRGHFFYLGTPTDPNERRMPFELALDNPGDAEGSRAEGKEGPRRTVAEKDFVKPTGASARQEAVGKAGMPRDLVLRGRYTEAARVLVAMLDQLKQQRERLASASELEGEVAQWGANVTDAYGALLGAQGPSGSPQALQRAKTRLELLWSDGFRKLSVLLEGAAADPLMGEVTYLLARCMHDQAERAQAKLNRARREGRIPTAGESRSAKAAWTDAARWWETYLEEHGNKPAAPAARWWRARVAEAVGDRELAISLLQNLAGNLTPLEKSARLYRAHQLKGD